MGSKGPLTWPSPESVGKTTQGAQTREALRATLPVRQPLKPEELRYSKKAFPPNAEIEYERSVIRIPFELKGKAKAAASQDVDIMAFDAYMRLIRQAPTRNGLGYSQFEFFIDAWELTNTYSKGLNADITFTISDCPQPKSVCVSLQRDSDYPALMVYNALYDIYVGKEKIVEKQPGVAMATPIWEIPPRNVTVAFEKPFESELFTFSAGTCEGMTSVSQEEFERGAAAARKVRGQD
jgi:hypothetical protein